MQDPIDTTALSPSPDAHLGPARGQRPLALVDERAPAGHVKLHPNEAAGYLMLGSAQWEQLTAQCEMLVQGNALHRTINTPAKAVMIALKAIEMGIPLTAAWTGMRFIDGEVCILGKLALRLIQQRIVSQGGQCSPIPVPPGEDWERAGWTMARPGETPREYWFTMEDARRAQLLTYRDKNGQEHETLSYKRYGNRMLRWRALATGAAYEFADVLQGCMIAEEMEHKDDAFIARERHERQRREAAEKRMAASSRASSTSADPPGRRELSRDSAAVERIVALIHQFASLYSQLHSDDDTDRDACYKDARRDKWADITERCIRGTAPTQEEARCCQQILEGDIRSLKDQIRTVQLNKAQAAEKEKDDDVTNTEGPTTDQSAG
jgi:hypothetical protein